MKIIKVIIIIIIISIQQKNGQSQINLINHNNLNVDIIETNTFKQNFDIKNKLYDSINNYNGVNHIARIGYSFYNLRNKKVTRLYSIELISGYRFSQYYYLGFGLGINPIKGFGLNSSLSSGTALDNAGNSHWVDSLNVHMLRFNFPIFLNQRINLYGSRKTSYSLNVNSGISLSNCYDLLTIFVDGFYWYDSFSENRLNFNIYSSIGIGIKRKLNRYGAVLLDIETDFISFIIPDNFKTSYFTIKLGFELNNSFLKK